MALRESIQAKNGAAQPLLGVLDQIEQQGSLLRILADRRQRVNLMHTLSQQGLVAWNKAPGRYELTPSGLQRLAAHRVLPRTGVQTASA
jgi:DNA-binding IclR family transcriptional regulator